jgi:group II intron reverse transcriptase/maturase
MGKTTVWLADLIQRQRNKTQARRVSEAPVQAIVPVPSTAVAPKTAAHPDERWTKLAAQIYALSNLAQAWRKVKSNGGGPGVDGESLRDFETHLDKNLKVLQSHLQRGAYEPEKVKRVLVPKASGGLRPLAILTIRDRIVQRAVYDVLAPRYEQRFLDCSYGFREGRSLHDAAARVAQWRDTGRRWVVDGDIKDCFERIDHRLLLQMIRRDTDDWLVLRLIERWLNARVFNEMDGRGAQTARDATVGTYQGGVISPLLANVYLHAFDQQLTQSKLALVRYADDWVILCTKKTEAEAALERATDALGQLRLAINPYKTRVVSFEEGFRFLGMFFVRNEQYALSPTVKR